MCFKETIPSRQAERRQTWQLRQAALRQLAWYHFVTYVTTLKVSHTEPELVLFPGF